MRRRKASQRVGAPPEAATVRCKRCSTRLGVLWPYTTAASRNRHGWDGFWTSATTKVATLDSGITDLVNEDWLEVRCSRCGNQWRGRDGYVHELLRQAPGGEVRLGQALQLRQSTGQEQGWQW